MTHSPVKKFIQFHRKQRERGVWLNFLPSSLSSSSRFLKTSLLQPLDNDADQYLNRSIHIFCCVLWNSCIKLFFVLFFFASPVSVIQSLTNILTVQPLSMRPDSGYALIWDHYLQKAMCHACLRLPPGKHFLGSSMGIAVFDLCYLDYNGAAEEDPLSLISSTHRQHTPSPSGPG